MTSQPTVSIEKPRPFVFVSAEDIFRPFIPARYIETKREAEIEIGQMMTDKADYRAVYMRPSTCACDLRRRYADNFEGLIYHPHFRPLTSPVAALLDLSATLHSKVPYGIPTPSGVLRTLASTMTSGQLYSSFVAPSPLASVANALTIPPIHVDHVAEAICIAVDSERTDVRGVYGVREMRELIGWSQKGQQPYELTVHA